MKADGVHVVTFERVLFWPESYRAPSASGFVLGWKEQQIDCCEQVLVAGMIAEESSDEDYVHQIDVIRKRIKQLMPCHCCSCGDDADVNNEPSSCCAGCTRRQLEGLDIIAYYEAFGSRQDTILPLISSSNGYPFWTKQDGYTAQQLIFFPDVGRNDSSLLFQLDDYSPSSSSSRTFTRLQYASTLVKGLSLSMKEDETLEKPRPAACSSPLSRRIQCPAFLLHQSLLCRHFSRSGYVVLFIEAVRAFSALLNSTIGEKLGGHCPVCQKSTLTAITHEQVARQHIQRSDICLRLIADVAVGLLLGKILLHVSSDGTAIRHFVHWYFDVLRQAVDWLNSFPIGFKLNERLTATLSHHVCLWLHVNEWCIDASLTVLRHIAHPVVVYVAAASFGGSSVLAVLYDALQLMTFHIAGLALVFGRIYQAELSLLYALWCLFRGKKRNILRNRTDTMEYDSTQLLFGTVLFVVALFLFTTVLVYQLFFAVAYLAVTTCLVSIKLPFVIVQSFPFGMLAQRALTDWFPVSVFLVDDESLSNEAIDVTSLKSCFKSCSSIISDHLLPALWPIASSFFATASCIVAGCAQITLPLDAAMG